MVAALLMAPMGQTAKLGIGFAAEETSSFPRTEYFGTSLRVNRSWIWSPEEISGWLKTLGFETALGRLRAGVASTV